MSKVVAISAGRTNKISEKAIEIILDKLKFDSSFFSLSNFEILTCDACNGCVKTNKCVKKDNLNKIYDEMKKSEIIIFAAPEYWDGANAKARAFWERICFSGRHNSKFPLKDKVGIIIGVSGYGDSRGVIKDISRFMKDAEINVSKKISIQGEFACFTCGCGENCNAGGIKDLYPEDTQIKKEKIPTIKNQFPHEQDKKNNKKKELLKTAEYINNLLSN